MFIVRSDGRIQFRSRGQTLWNLLDKPWLQTNPTSLLPVNAPGSGEVLNNKSDRAGNPAKAAIRLDRDQDRPLGRFVHSGDGEIRTLNLVGASDSLCQLELHPQSAVRGQRSHTLPVKSRMLCLLS